MLPVRIYSYLVRFLCQTELRHYRPPPPLHVVQTRAPVTLTSPVYVQWSDTIKGSFFVHSYQFVKSNLVVELCSLFWVYRTVWYHLYQVLFKEETSSRIPLSELSPEICSFVSWTGGSTDASMKCTLTMMQSVPVQITYAEAERESELCIIMLFVVFVTIMVRRGSDPELWGVTWSEQIWQSSDMFSQANQRRPPIILIIVLFGGKRNSCSAALCHAGVAPAVFLFSLRTTFPSCTVTHQGTGVGVVGGGL